MAEDMQVNDPGEMAGIAIVVDTKGAAVATVTSSGWFKKTCGKGSSGKQAQTHFKPQHRHSRPRKLKSRQLSHVSTAGSCDDDEGECKGEDIERKDEYTNKDEDKDEGGYKDEDDDDDNEGKDEDEDHDEDHDEDEDKDKGCRVHCMRGLCRTWISATRSKGP